MSSYNNDNTYNNAPVVPPRPSISSTTTSTTSTTSNVGHVSHTPDIVTSDNHAHIGSSSSFTTNVGPDAHVKSMPVTAHEAPLVQPSRGLLHSLKKAFTTGSNVEMDPVIAHANDTLHANYNHTRELDGAMRRYQQAQQAMQDAAVAVTAAFHHVLSDERNPYGQLSAHVMRNVQTHSIVPSRTSQLTELTASAVADMEEGMQSVEHELRDRKTKQSDVEYYLAKVDKLSGTQEQHLQNNPSKVSAAESEKLERNIGKAKEVQMEYNAENERVIANMNALWRRRIVRLGPALTGFIAQNQIVHQEQAQSWQQLLAASAAINPDSVHNTYLTDSSTVLVPPGSAVINNSQHLNQARSIVNKRIEVESQQRLVQENTQRQQAVQKTGGRLETVQQDVIVRSEEQMVWTKERFVTERVRLRKVVGTEMVTITVPVRRERIEIERIPVDGPGVVVSEEETAARLNRRNQRKQRNAANNNNNNNTTTGANNTAAGVHTTTGAHNTLSDTTNTTHDIYNDEYDDEQFEMVLCEERPRVVTDIVPVERIRMKKLTQVSTAHLEMDLRKEHIDFSAPNKQQLGPGQSLVTQTGTLQTIAGEQRSGFTDTTHGANVVVLPNMVSNQSGVATGYGTTAGYGTTGAAATTVRTAKADVDDVEAMRGIGVPQTGSLSGVNTVGTVTNDLSGTAGYGTTSTLGNTTTTGATTTGTSNVVDPNHPYYNSSTVKGTPDYATNESLNTNTTTTGVDPTAARRNVV